MPLLSLSCRAQAASGRDERGFTMVTVIISMLVVMLVSVAALSAAQGDLPSGKHDADRRIAYAAAEAGVQNYLFHLAEDANYWSKCTDVSAPVNDPWDGSSARKWQSVPGSTARYTIELLPVPGHARCLTSSPDETMIDPSSKTFRARITGQALKRDGVSGVKRTIVLNFKRQSLLDYVYFTDKEGQDPSLAEVFSGGFETDALANSPVQDVKQWASGGAGNTPGCNRYYGDNAQTGNRAGQRFNGDTGAAQTGLKYNNNWYRFTMPCVEIQFGPSDVVKGPLHTNDEILCANGSKYGRAPADRIEVASLGQSGLTPAGYRGCTTPHVNFGTSTAKAHAGTWKGKADGAGDLPLPASNSSLKRDTAAAYRFVGKTTIVMNTATMTVTGTREDGTVLSGTSVALPADGLVYVANSPTLPCTAYDPLDTANVPVGCGNLDVNGTYGVNVTLTAENDIVIKNDTKRASGSEALLGLISNNFIRVHHPVTNRTFTPFGSGSTVTGVAPDCDNNGSLGSPLEIDAAILSLRHSFTVDNYYCGNSLGTLSVKGSIVQAYRGAVGTAAGSGYLKNYTYDDRLKYRSPPKFLDPLKAGWVTQTYNEQVPAR